MTLPNPMRGEVALAIDGRPHMLRLTLGALAELEAAFDAPNLSALGERLASLAPSDLLIVLAALVGGGGEAMSVADLARAAISPKDAASAVAEAFRLAFED